MTRSRLRALVVSGLALLAALGSPGPARAHATISIKSPGVGQELPTSDWVVTAEVTAGEHSGMKTKVDTVELTVKQVGSERPDIKANAAPDADGKVAFPMHFAYNGTYRASMAATWTETVVVGGVTSDTGRATSEPREFVVDAPPVPPTDVKTAVDPTTRAVTVTWKANPEPDMLFYSVQRATGTSNEFVPVSGKVLHPETKFVDTTTAEAGGEYRYQVVAVRQSARPDEGLNSDPSALSPASTATVPAPPAAAAAGPGTTVAATAGGSGSPAPAPGTTLPANSPGALTTSGKVDLNGFNTVQSQARRTPRTVPPPDTGFQGTLPFAAQPAAEEPEESGELGELAADSPQFRELGSTEESGDRQRTMAFVAGGLLASVLLMHVLWVKSEVKRVPLEALAPEGPYVGADGAMADWFVPDRLGADDSWGRVSSAPPERHKVPAGL